MASRVPGAVTIANEVLADIAGYVALESYGIVGMASPTVADGVAQLLPRQKLRKGVRITSAGDSVAVDLYVIIEHGTQLAEVSHNLANHVRYSITDIANVAVTDVEVHVLGVKVRTAK